MSLTSLPLRGGILSGPIVNPANGHSYYLLNSDTWAASQAEASALGGNLVTINDAAENDWVFDTFSAGQRNLWIGLYDADSNGTYGWVDGTVLSYSNWDTGPSPQPDGGNERWVFIPLGDLGRGLTARKWHDVLDDAGYVLTYIGPVFGVVEMIQPTITSQPRGQVGYWGKSVTFSVGAVGSPSLHYQWLRDTAPIEGASGSSLLLTNLQATNAGNYSVVVTNDYGGTTSSNAYLTVNPAGVSLALYSGVTIDGMVGLTYGIQYSTNLSNPNGWWGTANVTLGVPTQLWFDVQPANQPQRYYRVVPGPIPVP